MLNNYTGKVFKGLLMLAVPLAALLALSAVELGGARSGLSADAAPQSACASGIQVIDSFALPRLDPGQGQVIGLAVALQGGGTIEAVTPTPKRIIPGQGNLRTYLYNRLRGVSAVQVTSCAASASLPEVQNAYWLIEQDGERVAQQVALSQVRREVRQGNVLTLRPKQTTRYAVPCDLSDPSGTVLVIPGMVVTTQSQLCLSSRTELTRLQRELERTSQELNSPWGLLFNREGLTRRIARLNGEVTALYQLSPYSGTVAGVQRDRSDARRFWVEINVEEVLSIP
ncbi:MAG TPA: hypothetical protein ENI60_04515 [Candidatus Fraserbacteria bacterium]|nr:hypothetical protein [Candidatus Fraserbacteria bacterium]